MRYPGGKNHAGTFQRIINLIPPHRVYVEGFLGSGAILRLKRPAAVNIGVDRLTPNPALLQAGQIIQADFLDWAEAYPWQGDEFVYLDPPYVHSTRSKTKMYEYEMTDADHERLLRWAVSCPARVLISGYPSPLYSKALAGWQCDTYRVFTRGHTWKSECLWFNYPRPESLHDLRYVGADYRDRWRIEKRRRRWKARLEKLNPLERATLFAALVDVMG